MNERYRQRQELFDENLEQLKILTEARRESFGQNLVLFLNALGFLCSVFTSATHCKGANEYAAY